LRAAEVIANTHVSLPARLGPEYSRYLLKNYPEEKQEISLLVAGSTYASGPAQSSQHDDRDNYLTPHVKAREVLSDIAYRVISLQTPGYDDSVYQTPATATYTFLEDSAPDTISWRISARYDGKMNIKDEAGEYRDAGKTECFKGQCSLATDASSPFFNPTFWGEPKGPLKPGMSWTVKLQQSWELGPAGQQTITVISVDRADGIIILKREGSGVGSFEGKNDVAMLKRDGKQYRVTVKYGNAHWVGQAVFQHGVAISDELLCDMSVELSSPEVGTLKAQQRQYMSLLQHPGPIAN
jgi:hypothetical protein